MEYKLDPARLSSIHLPDCPVIVFDGESREAKKVIISSKFDDDMNETDMATIRSTVKYKEQDITNNVTLDLEHLKSMLIDCVKSEEPMNIFENNDFAIVRSNIVQSFMSALQFQSKESLVMEDNSSKRFFNGLGVIYEGDKLVAVFESMRVYAKDSNHSIEMDHILFNANKEQLNSLAVSVEYYDLGDNMMLSFEGRCSDYKGQIIEEIKIKSYTTIDDTKSIVPLIKEAYKVPFFNGSNADVIGEQEYTKYRDSRLSVIAEARQEERKKAITSKFSDIDLF